MSTGDHRHIGLASGSAGATSASAGLAACGGRIGAGADRSRLDHSDSMDDPSSREDIAEM